MSLLGLDLSGSILLFILTKSNSSGCLLLSRAKLPLLGILSRLVTTSELELYIFYESLGRVVRLESITDSMMSMS